MIPYLTSPDVATRTLSIDASTLSGPSPLPLGEILPITIRQNTGSGEGLIYVKGQLINAKLPQNLDVGERLFAQVTQNGNEIIFKILTNQPAQTYTAQAYAAGGPLLNLTKQLNQSLRTPLAYLNHLEPLFIPRPDGQSLPKVDANALKQLLGNLNQILATPEQLGSFNTALSQLKSSADGSLAVKLREIAVNIRELVTSGQQDETDQFFNALRQELSTLLDRTSDDNQFVRQHIDKIIKVLTDEVADPKKALSNEQQLLRRVNRGLKQGQETGAEPREAIKNALANLPKAELAETSQREHGEADGINQLKMFASRLESLAQSQETLHQTNPLMQKLGEPALILLPFLVQGLITHTELTVQSRMGGKKKQPGSDDGNESGSSSEPYQRIQVSVPLPNLGTIDVDIAHRKKEIMVRCMVSDKGRGEFLVNELENLATLLREQGFESVDLVAHVGKHRSKLPNWSVSIDSSTSIIV